MAPTKTELIDLFWRSWWTAINSYAGSLLASGLGIVDISALDAAKVAAIGAVLTVVKSYASNKLGTGTATTRETPVVGPPPAASTYATPVD